MESIVAALALGTLYTLANYDETKKKETFRNNQTDLPNLNTPNQNFPVENKEEILNDPNHYSNPNAGVDKMFNKLRVLKSTGDIVEASTSYQEKEEETKQQPSSFLSLTGKKISEKGFRHNNMQPFFGSSVKQRVGDFSTAEAVLDNMQGAGTQQINKESIAPLFKPQSQMNWVHGMPSATDFIQSRMNPSRTVSGVKPWKDVHIGPGLNQKNGVYGSGGFNSGMEARDKWMPKTVDELRVATNPKTTYDGVLFGGAAGAGKYSRGIQPTVEKNRPDRFFMNNKERWFTTMAASGEANTARSTQPERNINSEGTSQEYFGMSSHGNNGESSKVPENYRPSNRICPKQLTKYPMALNAGKGMNDLGKDSFKNRPNARLLTSANERKYGNVSTVTKAIVAPVMDLLRPSRKQNIIGAIRPTGNASTTVPHHTIVNPKDRLKTTMKETTINNEYAPAINSNQGGNAYLANVEMGANKPTPQQRDYTNCEYINGVGNTVGTANAPVYNAAYNARLNPNREILAQSRAPAGNMKLYNQNINIKIDKTDSDRRTQRDPVYTAVRSTIPSSSTMGRMNGRVSIGSGQQCERNSADLLKAFHCNPYTKPLNSVA